jgi:transposase
MEIYHKLKAQVVQKGSDEYEKKQHHWRERIRDAYYVRGWSRKRIMRYFHISIHTVHRWTQSADQDCSIDNRGWPRGVKRMHTPETLDRIRTIHQDLTNDPAEFFTGASAIEHEWILRYDDPPPPLRTIGAMMREMKLSALRKKGRSKGAAAYLRYPEYTIYHGLGGRVIEVDFIKKFLTGRTDPLCFQSFSAKQSPKIRAFILVEAETADAFIKGCHWFLTNYEKPMYLKMDNSATMLGSASAKRTVSRVARHLLKKKIIPIFSVPRRPFTQASIEGSNSMFSRRFWTTRDFKDVDDVTMQLGWLNAAIIRYHGYVRPKPQRPSSPFVPRIYFIRQVYESTTTPQMGAIDVQHEEILLPLSYVKFFVLAEWNLEEQRLVVYFETEKQSVPIHERSFCINGEALTL